MKDELIERTRNNIRSDINSILRSISKNTDTLRRVENRMSVLNATGDVYEDEDYSEEVEDLYKFRDELNQDYEDLMYELNRRIEEYVKI